MTQLQIWLNLGGLGVLIALPALVYWLNTGERAVPGLIECLKDADSSVRMLPTLSIEYNEADVDS